MKLPWYMKYHRKGSVGYFKFHWLYTAYLWLNFGVFWKFMSARLRRGLVKEFGCNLEEAIEKLRNSK